MNRDRAAESILESMPVAKLIEATIRDINRYPGVDFLRGSGPLGHASFVHVFQLADRWSKMSDVEKAVAIILSRSEHSACVVGGSKVERMLIDRLCGPFVECPNDTFDIAQRFADDVAMIFDGLSCKWFHDHRDE